MCNQQDFQVPYVIRRVVDHVQRRDKEAVNNSEQIIKIFDAADIGVRVDDRLERMHERYHEDDEHDDEVQQVFQDCLDSYHKASN